MKEKLEKSLSVRRTNKEGDFQDFRKETVKSSFQEGRPILRDFENLIPHAFMLYLVSSYWKKKEEKSRGEP